MARKNIARTVAAALLWGLLLRYLISPPVYRVALALPADPEQPGWSSAVLAAADGIERRLAQQGVKAQVDYTIALTGSAEALTRYAAQGYDFIIAADDGYAAAAQTVAEQYPATKFALLGDAAGNGANLTAIALRHAEPGEMAGRVLALKTTTGQVAYLADGKNARRAEALRGLRAGVGNEAELQVYWHIGEPAEAADLAARLFDTENVDVICIDAGFQTMLAVYEAARQRPGKYVANWYVDLAPLYPDTTLGAYHAAPADALAQAAVWAYADEWPGRRISFGANDNAFNVTPLHNLDKARRELAWAAWGEIHDRGFEQ